MPHGRSLTIPHASDHLSRILSCVVMGHRPVMLTTTPSTDYAPDSPGSASPHGAGTRPPRRRRGSGQPGGRGGGCSPRGPGWSSRRWSSGIFIFVSTSKRRRRRGLPARAGGARLPAVGARRPRRRLASSQARETKNREGAAVPVDPRAPGGAGGAASAGGGDPAEDRTGGAVGLLSTGRRAPRGLQAGVGNPCNCAGFFRMVGTDAQGRPIKVPTMLFHDFRRTSRGI